MVPLCRRDSTCILFIFVSRDFIWIIKSRSGVLMTSKAAEIIFRNPRSRGINLLFSSPSDKQLKLVCLPRIERIECPYIMHLKGQERSGTNIWDNFLNSQEPLDVAIARWEVRMLKGWGGLPQFWGKWSKVSSLFSDHSTNSPLLRVNKENKLLHD